MPGWRGNDDLTAGLDERIREENDAENELGGGVGQLLSRRGAALHAGAVPLVHEKDAADKERRQDGLGDDLVVERPGR